MSSFAARGIFLLASGSGRKAADTIDTLSPSRALATRSAVAPACKRSHPRRNTVKRTTTHKRTPTPARIPFVALMGR
ncbi:hypothetical protein CMQ_8152 [Grosmannia clavigera kw1407]|uniref:Uncharacterized protein n=1 Tax=Grosmannia clavigera (strain kw1407 / UAMH 11150) TaxID=655863 RepID=F0XKV0_GROCL|nr:uncharacterized protein CMQ_8152 [Grosmannia clavigera kw1407]EFX01686.1 hypothetical protein CMQ_8152 [Grosmannia clavigera kw1407]